MKFFIETYGCAANVADSEIMAGFLVKKGHVLVKSTDSADIVIVNTCTVKGPTEAKIRSRIKQLQKIGKKLVIAGCMAEAQTEMIRKIAPAAGIVGTHKIDKVADVAIGKTNLSVGNSNLDKSALQKLPFGSAVDIIQINEGCLGNCSFCITKLARGITYSYPIGTIRNCVAAAVKSGCGEIWLTSQDTGTFGLDRRTNLPQLLKEVCKVKGNYFLRVGMMNPTLASVLLQPLINSFKDEHVLKFLHLPLQSGSDSVLAAMKRNHKVGTFKKIVKEFREKIPDITICTDIICGFPTETEADFKQTMEVIERVRPDIVNVSRFWPRPFTEAGKMKMLPDSVIMKRSKALHFLALKIARENNTKWLGWSGTAFVDEKGKVPGTWVARNFAYKPIAVKSRENLLGKFINVKVTASETTYLIANNIEKL